MGFPKKPEIKRCFPKRAKNIRKEPKKSEVIYSRSQPTTDRGIKQGCGLTPPMYIGFDIDIF